jgi:hypothetical protein
VWNMANEMVGADNFDKLAVLNLFNVAFTYKLWKKKSILKIMEALPRAAVRYHAALLARWLRIASAGRKINLVTFSRRVEEHFTNFPEETASLRDAVHFVPTSVTGMVHVCCFTQWGMQGQLRKNVDKWLAGASNFILALTGDAQAAQTFVSDFKAQHGGAWRAHMYGVTIAQWQPGQSVNVEMQWKPGQSGNVEMQWQPGQSGNVETQWQPGQSGNVETQWQPGQSGNVATQWQPGQSGNVATQWKSPGIFTRPDKRGHSWTTIKAAARDNGIVWWKLRDAHRAAQKKAAPGTAQLTFKCQGITWVCTRNGA